MNKKPKYNPRIHHRRSIWLKGYDYSCPGLYFITICVQNRTCLFGHIENGKMILNHAGQLVENEWLKILQRFPNVRLHQYVVMPNHFHAILQIITNSPVGATLVVAHDDVDAHDKMIAHNNVDTPVRATLVVAHDKSTQQTHNRATTRVAPTGKNNTLGDMVGAFQSIVTVEYIRGVKNLEWKPFNGKLWQRNYWEHIIRNDNSYQRISNYIQNNPFNWMDDKFYKE